MSGSSCVPKNIGAVRLLNPNYDVINDVIMPYFPGLRKLSHSDADCTPGREPS